MTYIIVDTCVFIRLNGVYGDTLEYIKEVCHIIAVTRDMEDEYRGRSTHDLMGLLAFMIDLKAKGKLKKFAESYVKEKVRRYENSRNINYPSHYEDRKWIRTAIATKAAFILTTNKHLLDTPPNISNGDEIKIVTPETYIQAH